MFRLEMLPAAHGDCLWIEYGDAARPRRLLIDGGPSRTYPALRARILQLPLAERHFDALVISHIDADHIEGVVRLLQDAEALGCVFDRIWFNGRDQLDQVPDAAGESLGALQGEMLGLLIADYEQRTGTTVWNVGWPDRLVAIDRGTGSVPRSLPSVEFGPGSCRLTLLSPDHERLLDLKDHWVKVLQEARMEPGDSAALRLRLATSKHLRPLGDALGGQDDEGDEDIEDPSGDAPTNENEFDDVLGGGAAVGSDNSRANGSSIALLLDYPAAEPTVRLLLAGDAWAPVLEASIRCLPEAAGGRLALTGFKFPHHGSIRNISEALLRQIACTHYLISTNGAVFHHPDARALDLLLTEHAGPAAPRLLFNYRSATTEPWADPARQQAQGFEAVYPAGPGMATVLQVD